MRVLLPLALKSCGGSQLSCPQIWNIEQEKDRGKENVGGRPAKLNEKKSDRVLELELLEEQHETFATAVRKREMLAATNARENERH